MVVGSEIAQWLLCAQSARVEVVHQRCFGRFDDRHADFFDEDSRRHPSLLPQGPWHPHHAGDDAAALLARLAPQFLVGQRRQAQFQAVYLFVERFYPELAFDKNIHSTRAEPIQPPSRELATR